MNIHEIVQPRSPLRCNNTTKHLQNKTKILLIEHNTLATKFEKQILNFNRN